MRMVSELPDMTLSDQNTSMMNTLRQPKLIDASLKSSLQEILDFESQYIIKLHTGFIKDAHANKTANEGISFKKSLWIFLVQSE